LINPRGWLAWRINNLVKWILLTLCKVDYKELESIPLTGPAIVVMNHVNFLEVPLVSSLLFPRPCVGLVKKETNNNPLFAFLGIIWGAILIDRDTTDFKAMNKAIDSIHAGSILLLAPEGTRSKDGILRQARHGVTLLAARTGAPVIPLGHTGGEQFWDNLKAFKRTPVSIRVGEPLIIHPKLNRSERELALWDIMGSIAKLLPTWQRGVYARGYESTDEQFNEHNRHYSLD
jgi:1-acyl-sn-glycerol-3-phosphate acyltransferase